MLINERSRLGVLNYFSAFISIFFSYAGYYAGLVVVMTLFGASASRLYSLPLRVFISLVLISVLVANIKNLFKARYLIIYFLISFFWILYYFNLFANFFNQDYRLPIEEYLFYSITYSILPFFALSVIRLDQGTWSKIAVSATIYSGFIFALLSLLFYWDYLISGVGRLSMASYDNPDKDFISPLALSYSAAITISFVLYKFLFDKFSWIVGAWLLLVLMLSGAIFLLGSSRGAFVSIILMILILFFFSDRKGRSYVVSFSLLSGFFLFLAAGLTGSLVFDRFLNTFDASSSTMEQEGRGDLWKAGLNYFYQSPIIGGAIEVDGFYPHNIVIETLMSTGFIGFILLFIPISYVLILGVRISLNNRINVWALMMFVHGLTQYMFSGSFYAGISVFLPMGAILSIAMSGSKK